MNCPFCNQKLNDSAQFCGSCGRRIPRCPQCGTLLTQRFRFCPNEGTPIPPELVEGLPEVQTEGTVPLSGAAVGPGPAQAWAGQGRRCVRCGRPCREGQSLCDACAQQAQKARKPGKKKKEPPWVWILAGCLAVLLIVGVGAGIWLMRSRTSAQSEEDAVQISGEVGTKDAEQNPVVQDEPEQPKAAEEKHSDADWAQQPKAFPDEPEPETVLSTASGLDPVPLPTIEQLDDTIYCGRLDTTRSLQGVEWNTDTMETYYVSAGNFIAAYDTDGDFLRETNAVGEAQIFSIDYYDGKVLAVMRSSSYGRFKLRVYDADTLELINSVNLDDILDQFAADKALYGDDGLIPYLGGITVAPTLGSRAGTMLYISYNCYYGEDATQALNENQMIFEYDFKKTIKEEKRTKAKRVLSVDLGYTERGIQTLEYDRTSENIWCAVNQGGIDLYCIDGGSKEETLSLISNGGKEGWECRQAGDGLCSLGNNWYYILEPSYRSDSTAISIQKVHLEDLESL